jgi:hypothetical protein
MWGGTLVVVRSFVKSDGFYDLFLNKDVEGTIGSAGCGFAGYGPSPVEIKLGASYKLYIWIFIGCLLSVTLKILDLKLDRPTYNPAVADEGGSPKNDEQIPAVPFASFDRSIREARKNPKGPRSGAPPTAHSLAHSSPGHAALMNAGRISQRPPMIELPPIINRDSSPDADPETNSLQDFPHLEVGEQGGAFQPELLESEHHRESSFV